MQALLGKIVAITPLGEAMVAGRAGTRVEISFKGACVLPERVTIPEWLKDQTLKVTREVCDVREVGYPGDSLVLTVAESARWLFPIAFTPVYFAAMPAQLEIALRWWKDDKPPEVTVRANGRQWSGPFTKEGDQFIARVDNILLFPTPPPVLPVKFDITCDKFHQECLVLPADMPYAEKLLGAHGELLRVRNAWYEIELTAKARGGGITTLSEVGRGNNHFRLPENIIQRPLEFAGHRDEIKIGWSAKLGDTALSCAGIRREGTATRVLLEGTVDEGLGLRTSVSYTIFDELPLLLLQREFALHTGKIPDKPPEGPEKAKEPIDEVQSASVEFHAAWVAEQHGQSGSRILCVEGERLAPYRPARNFSMTQQFGWRLHDGWAMVEHPRRREDMLYLFDGSNPPYLVSGLGAYSLTLEPHWPFTSLTAGNHCGFTLALTAGEIGGAAVAGGWVACRTPYAGGVRCAIVGTFRAGQDMTALVSLGGNVRKETLASSLLTGVGMIHSAVLHFPDGRMTDDFSATVAGIAERRHEHESI